MILALFVCSCVYLCARPEPSLTRCLENYFTDCHQLAYETQMKASHFWLNMTKLNVTVEQNKLETALSGLAGVKVRRNAAERRSGTSHFELSEFRHL